MGTAEPQAGERPRSRYAFGGFILDLDRGFLRRGAEDVELRPKPFQVLVYLVEHHGRIVAKSELIGAVWPDVAVMDNTVAQCMVEIRRALGDDSQQLIRTIARRGYLFACPVSTSVIALPRQFDSTEGERSLVPIAPEPPVGKRQQPKVSMSALALRALVSGAILMGFYFAWRMWRAPMNQEPLRAIPLNSLPGVERYPSFSPDGNQVAFTWTGPRQDNQDVYVQQIGSASLLRLTTDPRMDYNPVWSPNGRWIAFLRRNWEAGSSELRLIPPLGGPERKLTEILYYNETMEKPSPLWRLPVSGGVPVKVLEGIVRAAFTVVDRGIYYIDRPSGEGGLLYTDWPSGETRLQYFDLRTRRSTTVARNLGNVFLGLTASKDGRTILYSRVDFSMDDLMLVDNFR